MKGKFLTALLAGVMTVSVCTACGGDSGLDSEYEGFAGQGGGGITTPVDFSTIDQKEVTQNNIKLDVDLTQKADLRVLMPNFGTTEDSVVNNDYTAQAIERITGYDVTYVQLPATNASASLNTQMQSNTPYNAMKLTTAQFADMIKEDMLLPLNALISTYGPELQRVISQESWAVATVDGKIYGIPERASSDNIENPIILRQDWLDELGMSMPSNLTEFKDVLQAMKTTFNVTPLTFDMYTPLIYPISSAFGIYADWQEYDIGNGKRKILHYMEAPRYNEYVSYMADLYKAGLIDVQCSSQDASAAASTFYTSKAGAIATSLWSVSNIVVGFSSNLEQAGNTAIENRRKPGAVNTASTQEDMLCYVRSLADNGKIYRTSGYTYITAIPYYMAQNAGYVIDWMNTKITDNETTHNFRDIVLGNENEHWTYNEGTGYAPIDPAFATDKENASYFLTGSNETVYTEYWKARVRKNAELYRAWSELMDDADSVGEKNVVDAIPPLDGYSSNRAVETYAQDQFYVMLKTDGGTSKLSTYINKFKKDGGIKATNAINVWYFGS